MKPYRFYAEAEAEFRAAIDWYDNQRDTLGDVFADAIEAAIHQLCRVPRAFSAVNTAGVRRCPVRRFPYNVIYLELDDIIWIVAVAHYARRPGYWARRTPE